MPVIKVFSIITELLEEVQYDRRIPFPFLHCFRVSGCVCTMYICTLREIRLYKLANFDFSSLRYESSHVSESFLP